MKFTVSLLIVAAVVSGCLRIDDDRGTATKSQTSNRTMPNAGDVFTAKLPDGRYTAVRVFRTSGKSSLVATTEYLAHDRPQINDPLLHTTVIQHRFSWKGEPALKWFDRAPPGNFEFLGNIPPTGAESEMESTVYGGEWREATGNEAFLEWRWLHDRAAFEEEVRKQHEDLERRRRMPQKPKKMMPEEDFWRLIYQLDWEHEGNDEMVLAPAIKVLSERSTREICQFEERLAFLLYQLDTKVNASNIGKCAYDPKSDYVSADGFLYARCVVVANGRELYNEVLADPTKMPKDVEFESLLYLAPRAYELKTGKDFEYSTGCSYESFSNHSGWAE